MKLQWTLYNAQQGRQALLEAWEKAKPMLIAEHRLVLTLEEERRSLSQNDHIHAICTDLSKSDLEWFGKRRTKDEWKALLVSGHSVATKQGGEVVPGLEGELVAIRESTSSMNKNRGSSLISYALAFCAEHGVATTNVDS